MTSTPQTDATSLRQLPPDADERQQLHNEIHTRPSALIPTPALATYVAVLNSGVQRADEWACLRQLPLQAELSLDALKQQFLQLDCGHFTVIWERHTEFSRYTVIQPLPADLAWPPRESPALHNIAATGSDWLARLPGRCFAAIHLVLLHDPKATDDGLEHAARWLGDPALTASRMGNTAQGHAHSMLITSFRLRDDGFERMLVLAQQPITPARAGRITQRVLELETYRLMALRGLPIAKQLAALLTQAEVRLAGIGARLEVAHAQANQTGDIPDHQALLNDLITLAAWVERVTAEHSFRFGATRAYTALVHERIGELRERPVHGVQTIGEFMRRRLDPAIATVAAVEQRLAALSERVARTSALLRTQVDIETEAQNQRLLEKLTHGQQLQLRLQSTVEGLSIAAISYYVISLVLYGAKALKQLGLPLHPELVAGLAIPAVLWGVRATVKRIHANLHP